MSFFRRHESSAVAVAASADHCGPVAWRGVGSGSYRDRCRRRTDRQEALGMVDDEVVRTFKEIDYDGDGYITAMEFKLVMTRRREVVSGDEINSIFAHADDDGDGRINLAEFTKAWNS
jgi:hypothetical protein